METPNASSPVVETMHNSDPELGQHQSRQKSSAVLAAWNLALRCSWRVTMPGARRRARPFLIDRSFAVRGNANGLGLWVFTWYVVISREHRPE